MLLNLGSLKDSQYLKKAPVLVSLFKKVAGLKASNFVLRRPQHMCFPVNIAKFLITDFYTEHLQWLLLTVLPQYSAVSRGVCSLISRFHVVSIILRNVRKTLYK